MSPSLLTFCRYSETNSARAQCMICQGIRAGKTDLSRKVGIRLTKWKVGFREKVSFEQSRTKERASYACCLGYHMLHVPSNATPNAQASLCMIPNQSKLSLALFSLPNLPLLLLGAGPPLSCSESGCCCCGGVKPNRFPVPLPNRFLLAPPLNHLLPLPELSMLSVVPGIAADLCLGVTPRVRTIAP